MDKVSHKSWIFVSNVKGKSLYTVDTGLGLVSRETKCSFASSRSALMSQRLLNIKLKDTLD